MKINIIHKVLAIAAAAAFAMTVSSCEAPEAPAPEVSVKTPAVDCRYGQLFVSVKCSGDWRLSLEYASADQNWASISLDRGTGDRNDIIMSYSGNESAEDRTVWIILESESGKALCYVNQTKYVEGLKPNPTPDQNPDQKPEPEPEPEKPSDLVKTGWLELPAMPDNSGLGYYTHSFRMDNKTYRNYTFGWSQKDLVAIWMAYPLNKFYTKKTVNRSDAWNYDPLLGMKDSPAPFGGYGDELARGHQVPSADRLCCYEANAQTFYGTNMTPQLNAHNEGIWSTLEGEVRNWANTSDTTYVVTGCVVDGYTRTTTDSDGKKIHVPVAYWKALVRYHKASTISQWAGAAFYTEHKNYTNRDLKSVSMSIDELEEKIGIDLFVNLPARLGAEKAAELEAQNPKVSNIWW